MVFSKHRTWALLIVTCFAPVVSRGLDPAPKPKPKPAEPNTILDEKNPGHSVPLDEDEALAMDQSERSIEKMAADQENLKAGKITPQQYDKSLAETKQKVEETAAKFPESAPVQTSVARAFIQAGDDTKAVEHATQAMSLAPNDPFPVTTRSLAYYKAKDYPKAMEDAKKALEIDPNNSAARALYMLSKDRAPGGTILDASAARVRHVMETMTLPESPFAPTAKIN